MFTGEYQHTLDSKGRVILPARFRDRLDGGLVFTPGQDRCIAVYPQAVFERRVEEMRERPRQDSQYRAVQRVFLARAHQQTPDGQGRVTIPQRLREYAGLDRELAVVGADERVEIWDRQAWEDYLAGAEEAFASLDEPLEPGGGR